MNINEFLRVLKHNYSLQQLGDNEFLISYDLEKSVIIKVIEDSEEYCNANPMTKEECRYYILEIKNE